MSNGIALVNKNEWTIYDKDYEYNNDRNGFELVLKGEITAVFQVDLANSVAMIAGLFLSAEKIGVLIWSIGTGSMLKPIVKGTTYTLPYIKPIFKYPREKYQGVRDK